VSRPIRALIAKVGWDVHDIGAKFVTRALRDDGIEVIYTGIRRTIDEVVNTAIQEDVDVIGVSIIQSDPVGVMNKLITKLKEKKVDKNFMVLAGGLIPRDDIPKLKAMGVKEVFLPTTKWEDIPAYIRKNLPAQKAK
jgi:methylmalonyl-CoA mutase C-terminal domain/subunit